MITPQRPVTTSALAFPNRLEGAKRYAWAQARRRRRWKTWRWTWRGARRGSSSCWRTASTREHNVGGGSGDPLEPPGPLLANLHAVYMECSERCVTRLDPLAERAAILLTPGEHSAIRDFVHDTVYPWLCQIPPGASLASGAQARGARSHRRPGRSGPRLSS